MNTVNQSTICNKNTHRNCENYRNHCYNLQLPLQLLFAFMHGRPILTWIIFKLYSANKPKLFCCCFFLLLLFILHVKIQRRLVRWMSTQQLFSVCAQRCLGSWEENTECMRCTALTAVYFLYTSVGCEWRVAFALRYMLLVVVVVVVFFLLFMKIQVLRTSQNASETFRTTNRKASVPLLTAKLLWVLLSM